MNKFFAIVLLACALGGCYFVDFEDVSDSDQYSGLVGKLYVSSTDTLIHTITMDKNYKSVPDYYVITVFPGFDGPEVLMREALPRGTTMRVKRIRRCTNCLLEERIELIVTITTSREYDDADISINLKSLFSENSAFYEIRSKSNVGT